MTIPDWNLHAGPLEIPVPIDPNPQPGVTWQALYDTNQSHVHQDSQDALFATPVGPPKWGTDNPAQGGGSGVSWVYNQDDLDAIRVAVKGWKNNPVKPDTEHALRDFIYAMAGFDRTHEVSFAREVQKIANRGTVAPWFSLTGEVLLDSPGWRPQNLECLLARAQGPDCGQGLRYSNLRALGTTAYLKAGEHKCARILGAAVSKDWMLKYLQILDLAAVPNTGQIGSAPGDAAHPLDQPNCEYSFHWGFAAMGALACAKRCSLPVPSWIITHLNALDGLPSMTYQPYGVTSLPSFTYSDSFGLRVATGTGQNGDPAFGWWSSVCVAVAHMIPAQRSYWLERSKHWGPWQWDGTSEQDRKFTMLYRGATAL
jgi:hypothetical protein